MTEHERRELEPPALTLSMGSLGPDVKRLQEWLCLHGFHTAIDGDFGPATEAALEAFQEHNACAHESGVGPETWAELTWPMRRAVRADIPTTDVSDRVLYVAHEHLACRPREVGGPNSGPWVRLYMDGHEGKDWPWCAGFATYVLRQALGHEEWRTFSCDELAQRAHARWLLVCQPPKEWQGPEHIKPGDLFLIRNTERWPHNWIHCGIVTAVHAEHFETIEGNTNQDGRREGTEVCKRVRAFNARTDFVLLGDGP